MSTQDLKRVAYVALTARDPEAQARFYRELAGLEETERDDEGRIYLRCDAYHHALVLVPGAESGLDHYGLDVGSGDALENAIRGLETAGVSVREPGRALRGQGVAVELEDPAGLTVRLVAGTERAPTPYSVRAVQPRKLGHINNRCPDPQAVSRFYVDVLGFRVSDWLGDQIVWLRCNPDHHGVAYAKAPDCGLHHLAFEVASATDLLRQADHLAANGRRLLWGPGRHGPGHNLFIYFHDAEDNVVELTTEVEQIWTDENREPPWDPARAPHWANLWGPAPGPELLWGGRPGA